MKFHLTATCKKYLFDKETAISLYLKIREHYNQCILLENSEKTLEKNHFSYICFEPIAGIAVNDLQVTYSYPNQKKQQQEFSIYDQILPAVIDFFENFKVDGMPDNITYPGLFGYSSYDAVRYFENIDIPAASTKVPEIKYDLYRYVIVIDHLNSDMLMMVLKTDDEAAVNFKPIESIINNFNVSSYPFKTTSAERANCSEQDYLNAVEKGRSHCFRGDVFQVVLSRAFEMNFSGDDFNLYRALRAINPSPYLFYFDFNNFRLFGSSPEAQIKITKEKAIIHPIAGTYRRTGDRNKDLALAEELKNDKKENAEHIMLVDLARNDLSKHYQNVHLAEYRKIEMFSHVIHLVSKVEAENMIDDTHQLTVMADTFPAGTLTGAPKYKAMSIINETEPTPRGFYGGCIGIIGLDGSMNTAIMIRSFLSKNNTLHYQAGAGITAASVPENELQEINNKIGALRKALELANNYK